MSGDDLLNIDNYTFRLYNAETKTEEEISYEALKALLPEISPEELYSLAYKDLINYVQGLKNKYFGEGSEWKWNNATLESELQNLVSQVSGLEYMQDVEAGGYESTTEIPNLEAEKQKLLYANVTGLILNIDKIIETAYMIQDSIEITEETKSEEASELEVADEQTNSSGTGFLGMIDSAIEKGKEKFKNIVESAYEWLHPDPKIELPGVLGYLQRGFMNAHHGFDELIWGILGYDVPELEDPNKIANSAKKPLGKGGGGQAGGGSGRGGSPEEPEKPSNHSGGGYYGGGYNPSPETNTEVSEGYDIKKDFPKWEEIYTDENRLVYESEEGYKVVIHHNEEEITGVEHYYDFKTEANAEANYDKVINKYVNEDYADVVIRNGQYIKMVYKEESYSGMTLSKFKERFADLKLVEKSN